MTNLQLGRAYPLAQPKVLQTKRDQCGNKYEFESAWFQPWPNNRVRVLGLDAEGIWCRREYKMKKLPKWLRRGIENGMQSQV